MHKQHIQTKTLSGSSSEFTQYSDKPQTRF